MRRGANSLNQGQVQVRETQRREDAKQNQGQMGHGLHGFDRIKFKGVYFLMAA